MNTETTDFERCKRLWKLVSYLGILESDLEDLKDTMKHSKNLRRFTVESTIRDELQHLRVSRNNIEKSLEHFGETARKAAREMANEVMLAAQTGIL